MPQVRVRFAPSPTGFFHIGSARTALFNWLYARHTGGVFILRIEDTDKERNTEAFLNLIYDSLTWLGLNWDEGPRVGGAFGPYRQSERAALYRDYLDKLRATGRTYEKDGATWFRISGAPQLIDDAIRGRVERTEEKDFVIVRSDGNPVFHFVNVVDDIAMAVTHVIRGEDHLSNTSKHTELFHALGAPRPVYAHIPLILKQNGPGKMSKRDQGALVEEYQRRGFLPEALVNFLCLLGWSPKDNREKLPLAEIIRLFDLPGIVQSNARFDDKKLAHMNMDYLQDRDFLPDPRFVSLAREHFVRVLDSCRRILAQLDGSDALPERIQRERLAENLRREVRYLECALEDGTYFGEVMRLCRPKIKSLDELWKDPGGISSVSGTDGLSKTVAATGALEIAQLPSYCRYFFTEDFPIDPVLRDRVMAKGDPKTRLRELAAALAAADFSHDAAIEETIKSTAASHGLGFGDYQAPARLAVSGTNVGPNLTGMLRVLGRERVQRRLARFLAAAQ
jgi:glutamyl/glutaminyl-tRNA synthetase